MMKWTRKPPTTEGWYWICPHVGDQVEPAHVRKAYDGYVYFVDHEGNDCFVEDVSWWSKEPIQVPDPPTGEE